MREISSIGEEILASQEELCSKELVGFSFPIYSLTLLTHLLILNTHKSSCKSSVSFAQFNHKIGKCLQHQNPASSVHVASCEHTEMDIQSDLLGAPHGCEHTQKKK